MLDSSFALANYSRREGKKKKSCVQYVPLGAAWSNMGEDSGRRGIDLKQYSYKATSNLVLQQDRRSRSRAAASGTDEVTALEVGALDGAMGDRLRPESDENARRDGTKASSSVVAGFASRDTFPLKRQKRSSDAPFIDPRSSSNGSIRKHGRGSAKDVVTAAEDLGLDSSDARYVPRTQVSQMAFEGLLAFVLSKMGDYPRDVLRDAAEECLVVLKDPRLRETERKALVEKVLSVGMNEDEFSRLTTFGRQIKDFGDESDENDDATDPGKLDRDSFDGGGAIDEEQGVAVVFDDDDDPDHMGAFSTRLGPSDDAQYVDHVVEADDDSDGGAGTEDDNHGQLEQLNYLALVSNSTKSPNKGALDDSSDRQLDKQGLHTPDNSADEGPIDMFSDSPSTATNRNRKRKRADDEKSFAKSAISPDAEPAVKPSDVDAYWLQRRLSNHYRDAQECKDIAEQVFEILASPGADRSRENRLVLLLDYDKFDLVKLLLRNRATIVYCIKYARSTSVEGRAAVQREASQDPEGARVLDALQAIDGRSESRSKAEAEISGEDTSEPALKQARKPFGELDLGSATKSDLDGDNASKRSPDGSNSALLNLRMLDLDDLSFSEGSHLMSVKEYRLPGTVHQAHKDYEEWHILASRIKEDSSMRSSRLIQIGELPDWAQPAFPNTKFLNLVQSKVYPCAFHSDENMLLCAPTGAGKTNVAMLAILRSIANSMADDGLTARLDTFKVVYIAPMKALVTEVVLNLGTRLDALGLKVRELTGDVNLTKKEVEDTNVIVTTPEKWDIITRKSGERTFTELVRLIIVDEIHLLHDERGPVLEGIVARTVRAVESGSMLTRIVGLSATLPNYADVAAFMHVNTETGLFHFDGHYRPCPLQQCYVGITSRKALKRLQLINEVTYEKVRGQVAAENQVIVFVHSRKDTANTARYLTERAVDEEVIDQFIKPGTASFEIVQSESSTVQNHELAGLLDKGVGIHHAGLPRVDRSLVEELFAAGHIKVLVSTATLAWGVNLPAHAVIIRGTQVYSPARGRWVELSPMDVMQMMGRAGRPQFDTHGEGFIITTKPEVLFYLYVLNQKLPIESQMIGKLCDMLNAEISSGSVASVVEASRWLSYTYLYIRMLRNPTLYGVSLNEKEADPALERRRLDLAHTALTTLVQAGLIVYNRQTGDVQGTSKGRIAADYYISHQTMSVYSQNMRATMNEIELFRVFALSGEFKYMRVREEEKLELIRLAERVPIPVKESIDEPSTKVNVLLQSFISKLKLDGLALAADMVYVTQSAARLCRALLQIALSNKWAGLVDKCLALCKCVGRRQWNSQTPLRQFLPSVSEDTLRRIERKDVEFERYYDLTVAELGELLRNPKIGRTVHKLVHSLPKMEIEVRSVQPVTRSMIRIDAVLIADFRFEAKVHGHGEPFLVWVEDADSETLLHVESFYLPGVLAGDDEHKLTFYVPVSSPLPPQYFIRCVSDRWISPDSVVPVSLKEIVLPSKTAHYTELLDLQPLLVDDAFAEPQDTRGKTSTGFEEYLEALSLVRDCFMRQLQVFNPIQTQAYACLFRSSANCVIAAPPGSGRFVCAQLALANLFLENRAAVALFVASKGDIVVKRRISYLQKYLGANLNLFVKEMTGDVGVDIRMLRTPGSIVVTTPEKLDMLSRRWQQKKEGRAIGNISLIILDNVHLIGGSDAVRGSTVEAVGSRMRYVSAQAAEEGRKPCRIVAIMDSVANARDIGHWLGAPLANVLSFHPSVRPGRNQTRIEAALSRTGGGVVGSASTYARPVFRAIGRYASGSAASVVVFVASRRMARSLAFELLSLSAEQVTHRSFRRQFDQDNESKLGEIRLQSLRDCVAKGIGYVHEDLSENDCEIVLQLFTGGCFQILISTAEFSWMSSDVRGQVVVIAGTSAEEAGGYALGRAEYSLSELGHMAGRSGSAVPGGRGVCVILTELALKEQYSRLLKDPLPVESHLDTVLADQINAEVAARVIQTKQQAVDYLTWTLFYRRLPLNPNYYSMGGNSPGIIQDHLSDLVERALTDLESSKCVAAVGDEEMALGALNLGMIASHYYVRHSTIEIFASSVKPTTRIPGLLDIVASSSEYDNLAVRIGEDSILQRLSSRVPIPLTPMGDSGEQPSFADPHVKVHLLLQSHLSRLSLAGDISRDRNIVVGQVLRLIRSLVDVVSSAGWLKPALSAMELCQMIVQGMWDSDPWLAQLPHLDSQLVQRLREDHGVDTMDKLLDMDGSERAKALQSLSRTQMDDVARACNSIPDIKGISAEVVDETVTAGGRTTVLVTLEREEGDDDDGLRALSEVPSVFTSRYPKAKEEGWWLVIGEESTGTLLSLKYVTFARRTRVKLDLTAPLTPGTHSLVLYLISDSYVGECDQEEEFELNVVEDEHQPV